jgi:hypothetical protein
VVRALSVVAVLAVIALSVMVRTPVVPRTPLTRHPAPAVALTALAQPLVVPNTVAPTQPLERLGQQVNFHIAFVSDFLATGAVLFAREFAIPGTLLNDVQNGTPLPDAASRALLDFVDVEIEAGRRLVGFAVTYVDFQVHFLANILRDVIEFASSLLTGRMPAPSTEPSSPIQAAATTAPTPNLTTSTHDDAAETIGDSKAAAPTATATSTRQPKKPKPVVAVTDSVTTATDSAQGEVRHAITEPSETEASATTSHRDTSHVPEADQSVRGNGDVRPDSGDTDNPATSKKVDSVR